MYGPLLSGSPLPWSLALEVRNTVNIFLTPSYRTSTEQGLSFKAPGTVVNTSSPRRGRGVAGQGGDPQVRQLIFLRPKVCVYEAEGRLRQGQGKEGSSRWRGHRGPQPSMMLKIVWGSC